MKNTTLVVVGSGIKFLSHLTVEVKVHIEQADQVFYLVNNPAMKEWIKKTGNASNLLILIKQALQTHID